MTNKPTTNPLSSCCNAPVNIEVTTGNTYWCSKCGFACAVMSPNPPALPVIGEDVAMDIVNHMVAIGQQNYTTVAVFKGANAQLALDSKIVAEKEQEIARLKAELKKKGEGN